MRDVDGFADDVGWTLLALRSLGYALIIGTGERLGYGEALGMTTKESRQEKVARYRRMADQAEATAKRCTLPATRNEYLKLARDWRLLADEIERG